MTPLPSPPLPAQEWLLSRWSRGHALLLGAALAAAVARHAAWPVAACAGPSFAALLWLGRSSYSPRGRFGWANRVTALRVLLSLFLTASPALLTAHGAFAIVLGVLGLDLLDGWLARRYGDASPFGAHFDMEADALLVLVVTLRLWLGAGFASWVLFPGALRYAYVLAIWCWPETREAPRSRLGRSAFAILMLGLLAGLVLPEPSRTICVLFGSLVVSASFARSAYFSRASS